MKLVLLHSLPLDASMWLSELSESLEECVAPELYAFGAHIEDWARGVLDLAGEGEFVLVGNSVGGSCAIEIALLAPDKVAGLVLSGTNAAHHPDPQLRDDALLLLATGGIEAAWERYWRPLFGPAADRALLERAKQMALRLGPEALARGVRAFHARPDRDDFLDSWAGPVWVVSGEFDIRPERSRRSAARLSGGHYREVPGVGHYVPLEAPEVFVRIVREALQSNRG